MLRWLRIRLNQIRSDQIRSDSLLWPCLLLQAFPDGAKAADAQGNLPLHTAARSSFKTPELVELILAAYPDAVTMENSAGKLPHDLDRSYGSLLDDVPWTHGPHPSLPPPIHHSSHPPHIQVIACLLWQVPARSRPS